MSVRSSDESEKESDNLLKEAWRKAADEAYEAFARADSKDSYENWMKVLKEKPKNAGMQVAEALILAQHQAIIGFIDELHHIREENMILKQLMDIIEVQKINLVEKPDDAAIN